MYSIDLEYGELVNTAALETRNSKVVKKCIEKDFAKSEEVNNTGGVTSSQ